MEALQLALNQYNPRAHKTKIGTPPPKKPQIPPPPKTRNFMGMEGFPAERAQFFQAPIKLAQPFPARELRANNFTGTRIFLKGPSASLTGPSVPLTGPSVPRMGLFDLFDCRSRAWGLLTIRFRGVSKPLGPPRGFF